MKAEYAYTAVQDQDERERLLLEHLPQVNYIARRIHDRLPAHIPLADLVQAGVVGLIDAMAKYDPSRSVQFQSYAAFRIRGAILDSLRELDWGPRELRRKGRQLQEVTARLESELGRAPAESEVAAALGLQLDDFHGVLTQLRGLDLTQLPVEADDDTQIADIPGDCFESPYTHCERLEIKRVLTTAIASLPEKEQQVLSLYYHEELTMKEVGAVLGIGESRVSQIHSMALVRLRAQLSKTLGRQKLSELRSPSAETAKSGRDRRDGAGRAGRDQDASA
jgi:RNA polymerase sigma factor for flagellar operon FliA